MHCAEGEMTGQVEKSDSNHESFIVDTKIESETLETFLVTKVKLMPPNFNYTKLVLWLISEVCKTFGVGDQHIDGPS